VCAGHEGGQLLVAHLHEVDVGGAAAEGAHEAVDAVARVAEDAAHAPLRQALEHEIADGVCHADLLVGCST
jgi:hypothetical protein